ncbi:MAG: rhodanese-like domain-containing protein [Rhodospirillales bacterium]
MSDDPPLEIDVHALREIRESEAPHTVLDVREPNELAICALPGTLNIRMMDIPDRLGELPKDKPLLVLCRSGARSLQVTQWLRMNGFGNAQNVAGGILAWGSAFDPGMQQY